MGGEAKVGEIGVAEIELDRGARALDHDDVEFTPKDPQAFGDHRPEIGASPPILASLDPADRSPEQDDLAAAVALGLEEDRVHLGARGNAGRLCLGGLRPPDFTSVVRDGCVQ